MLSVCDLVGVSKSHRRGCNEDLGISKPHQYQRSPGPDIFEENGNDAQYASTQSHPASKICHCYHVPIRSSECDYARLTRRQQTQVQILTKPQPRMVSRSRAILGNRKAGMIAERRVDEGSRIALVMTENSGQLGISYRNIRHLFGFQLEPCLTIWFRRLVDTARNGKHPLSFAHCPSQSVRSNLLSEILNSGEGVENIPRLR